MIFSSKCVSVVELFISLFSYRYQMDYWTWIVVVTESWCVFAHVFDSITRLDWHNQKLEVWFQLLLPTGSFRVNRINSFNIMTQWETRLTRQPEIGIWFWIGNQRFATLVTARLKWAQTWKPKNHGKKMFRVMHGQK